MIIVALCTGEIAAQGAYEVDVEAEYGLNNNPTLKAAIEKNTSALLRAMNRAADRRENINYSGINISPEAKQTLNDLWQGQTMTYAAKENGYNIPLVGKVTKTQYGEWELRNIPMTFIDRNNTSDSHYEEIGINYNNQGQIEDVFVTIEKNQFQKILDGMTEVKDESNRYNILYYMEAMKTAYERHNLDWFRQYLSNDVLVVTGSRRYTRTGETFEYRSSDKTEYLNRLSTVFKRNPTIRVEFNDMTIIGHAMDDAGRYYAVECIQKWYSTHYSDVGRLFILWDFGRPEQPQILFRGWTELDDPTRFNIYDMPVMLD